MTAFIFGIISIIFALVIGAVGGFILAMYVMDEAEKEKKAEGAEDVLGDDWKIRNHCRECNDKCTDKCTCSCHDESVQS
tara:strand:+ start:14158 stop:14394 length:237 start_codon:yes stop_codon:yes gene_type:complete